MLLAMKDEAGSNLKDEENDFMLYNSYGDETLKELTVVVIMMARFQSADDNAVSEPSYDAKAVSEYKETCEELEREICADKDTIKRILKEKDKIESDFFKIENEKIIIQHETRLAKKAFKERENRYLEDIYDLEEKLSSHDQIVYKMDQSIQTIHMLGKEPNKVYDPFLKAGLGYKNPEHLKKAIAAQPKMYDGEMLHSISLKIDSPDSKETLEDAEESVECSNSVRRPKSKDTKSKDRVLKNTNDNRPFSHVQKTSGSVSIDSNKHETMHSNVCQSNASVLNAKTVNAVNDGSNIVCVSCGKDVFLLSHEKCVACYALSRDSKVERALFTTPIAAKSKNLRATSVVAKSRLSVAKTPTTINKVSSVLPLSPDSSQSRTLSNYMKNKIATSKKWYKWFKNQQCFNWTSKSKIAQQLSCETKSSTCVIQLVLWIVDSGCSKHMTGNMSLLRNFIEKFMGTICFRNDHFAAINEYGDYVQGNLMIYHVYYVEGLGHNLFSVRQFCDANLEVAFRSNTCYVQNLEGDDLLTSSRESNRYTISISELAASSPVCLTSKATSTKSWLWHRRLSHLNFACEQGKRKTASFPSHLVLRTESKLELIHMDLYGPMRVERINGKKYILMIVDDYSRYTWVYFLRTKDEAPDTIINFINQVQRNLKAQILKIRTDNGTEFKNEKLRSFYAKLGIIHHTRNLNVQYFHVFGSLCYPTNDHDDLGKMKPNADIGIFIGYSESSRGFSIYNRRTKKIMEMIHSKFDELTTMASECNNLEPEFNCMNFQDLSEDSQSLPTKTDLDNLFGPLYVEYYLTSPPEVSDNSAANTLDNKNTSSSSSIVVEEDEAPQIVSSSTEQVASEPNTPVFNENADEFVQEDVAKFDGNVFYYPPQTPVFEEAESSSTYQDP
ncbi:retrovirus-related pol polyprotein from transposon TNT 1-94 [Tanacetum coccineum]